MCIRDRVILAIGKNPLLAYMAIYKSVFSNMRNFSETIAYVTPLIFTGLAVAFAFRCGLFNICLLYTSRCV